MQPLPQRKSPRLPGYDYSQSGLYFVTICTYKRQHLFGNITDDTMRLSTAGKIASEYWLSIPEHYPDIELGLHVIMPNHMHGVLCLRGDSTTFTTFLGRAINAYKGAVTTHIRGQQTDAPLRVPTGKIWQARYHDHIIRSEADLQRIEEYILNNPARWAQDKFFSE